MELSSILTLYTDLHVKYRYSCQMSMKLEIFNRFSKTAQISNFMKIHRVEAELFHADRRDEAKSRFSQFCGKGLKTKSLQKSLSQKSPVKIPHNFYISL